MSDETEQKQLDADELEDQRAEELPDREVMSVMHPGPPPIPIDPLPPETI
jgi:hypothetical protein